MTCQIPVLWHLLLAKSYQVGDAAGVDDACQDSSAPERVLNAAPSHLNNHSGSRQTRQYEVPLGRVARVGNRNARATCSVLRAPPYY